MTHCSYRTRQYHDDRPKRYIMTIVISLVISLVIGMVKWVSAFGLSNNKWRWWMWFPSSLHYRRAYGLVQRSAAVWCCSAFFPWTLALTLSHDESWWHWQHHKHCPGYYYYYYYYYCIVLSLHCEIVISYRRSWQCFIAFMIHALHHCVQYFWFVMALNNLHCSEASLRNCSYQICLPRTSVRWSAVISINVRSQSVSNLDCRTKRYA